MPSKQAQRREAAENADKLSYRAFEVRGDTVDIDGRSVGATISTESPVRMPDFERMEMIPEVLRTDGAVLPTQVPLLDSHQRRTMDDQLGSVRGVQREANEVGGRLHFSADERSMRSWEKVRDKHATDVSAGYQVLEKTFVPRGKTQMVAGRSYTGPVNVVTKWKLREVSLTPIGADEQAKLRGFDPSAIPDEKGFEMNEQLRSLLESRGMPKDLSDDDARQQWAIDNNFGEKKPEEKKESVRDAGADFESRMAKIVEEASAKAAAKALEDQQKRATEQGALADTVLKIADVERTRELDDKLSACRTREDIEKVVLDHKAEQQSAFPSRHFVTSGPQEHDKFEAGMRTALIERSLGLVGTPEALPGETDSSGIRARREQALKTVFPQEKRSKDAKSFENASLLDMANEYVSRTYRVRTLDYSREQIAIMALFGPQRSAEILGLAFRDAPAYHVTGSFANLTLDAINKSMMMGYTEAPSTWEAVMRVGADANDFKELHRMRLGAVPNIPVWPDSSDPKELSVADAREHYGVEAYSAALSFSYRLLINDDMDALSRLPGQFGQAARRTLNKRAWSVITANAAMSDGVALFAAATGNRKRTNLTTGAGAPSTSTLQTLSNLMMQMRGENTPENNESDDVLSITPRYIVGPGALYTTIVQLVKSQFDPADANQKYNTAAILTPIIEPLLDVASTTAWYLFADPGQVDTVEVTFLKGHRTPTTRQELNVENLSQKVYVLQAYGAKALNHRGMQKHAGA